MGADRRGELSVSLLSLGHGRSQGTWLWQGTDGILYRRCPSTGPLRDLYAGSEEAKSMAFRPVFCEKVRFGTVDSTPGGYELLALSFDGTYPAFAPNAKKERIESEKLTVYYDLQCPFILQKVDAIKRYCAEKSIPADFFEVDTLGKAKALPAPFNNWAVFYKGQMKTVNLLDVSALERILRA